MNYKKTIEKDYKELQALQTEEWNNWIQGIPQEAWDDALENFQETPLKTKAQRKAEIINNLEKLVDSKSKDDIFEGFAYIMDHEKRLLNTEEHQLFHRELNRLRKEIEENGLKGRKPFSSLYDHFHLSEDFLRCIQKIGMHALHHKHLEEARVTFEVLVYLAPPFSGSWISLGKAYEALGNSVKATGCYLTAGLFSPDDPFPYLLAAHANLKENKLEAKKHLDFAKELIETSPVKYPEEVAYLQQAII